MMLKKTIDLVPLVALAALAGSLLDHLLSGRPSEKEPIFHSAVIPPRHTNHGNGSADSGWMIREHDVFRTESGLAWSCPKDRYAKEFGELALRQLQGRYWIGANGHLYLKASNHEHRSLLLRFFPASAPSSESWSWLAEIANYHGPEVWSCSRDISPEERREGVQWRGGFLLLRRVLDPATFEPKTLVRLFSHQEGIWENWQPGIVVVCADASRKNGQWHIQWRMEADRGRFVLANDPGINPGSEALYREPFFLLPVAASDLP
ncbi:MAG: hypothetical protein PHO89_11030 [Methylacidiphilaceae bacterium]|nr:hypothetical protein [Candidatus Methylacidiphilaceae bacterium]